MPPEKWTCLAAVHVGSNVRALDVEVWQLCMGSNTLPVNKSKYRVHYCLKKPTDVHTYTQK